MEEKEEEGKKKCYVS